MIYSLYKLKFTTPIHAGDGSLDSSRMTFCADTLFSALCHTAPDKIDELCSSALAEKFLLTDMLPFKGDTLFIPRPIMNAPAYNDVNQTKKIQKLDFIPVTELKNYMSYTRGRGKFDAPAVSFGEYCVAEKNTIRNSNHEDETATPYNVGTFRFNAQCGLYFIIGCESEEYADEITSVTEALGIGGIGGKVSAGYGKFTFAEDPYIFDPCILYEDEEFTASEDIMTELLYKEASSLYISLTTSLPTPREYDTALDGASYGITRRGGFVSSETFSDRLVKKQTQYFLSAGSVFKNRYNGSVYNVADNGTHNVFRYAKPIFLGAAL